MELMTQLSADKPYQTSLRLWLELKFSRLERWFRFGGPSRAAGKTDSAGKVRLTSDTAATPVTPVTLAKHHTWTQIMLVPVTVVPDPDDGEPMLFLDEEAFRLAKEDPRVGCLHCSMSLDEGWDIPCDGS